MPQIQRPNKPTATTIKEAKPFRDRLRDRYAPSEYVRVKNIDDEDFDWQYFPTAGEDTSFTDNGTVRVVEGRQAFTKNYEHSVPGNEQAWMIKGGTTEVLVGENADLFIEGLYKKLVAKSKIAADPIKESDVNNVKVRKFNWTDGLLQEQMIDKIFQGKEQPNFSQPINDEPITENQEPETDPEDTQFRDQAADPVPA